MDLLGGRLVHKLTRRVAAGVVDLLRDRRGGAMTFAGIGAAMIMATAGAGLVNLAWHEAHREEVRAAMRAAVASVGASLLARAGDQGAVDAAIKDRVDAFVEASTAAVVDNVTVSYEDGRVGVGLDGSLDVDDLWRVGRMLFGGSFTENVAVELVSSRHEFAVALDVSPSMDQPFGAGTRMDGLKAALATVASNLETAQRDSPAGMLVSIVPFASAVRVADTAGAGQTEDKARYLRMMGGRARAKWVDIYHHYGVGGEHETAVPAGWDWDTDRFTGCLMARWGAYWEPSARPVQLAWPVTLGGEPLHLSDAAPDPRNANTLFVPYSWPNAAPAGNIDARLQWAMADLLAARSPTGVRDWFAINDWSLPESGGDMLCPEVGVTPLTDDVALVRRTVAGLRPIDPGPGGRGATYTHLGIVWGMRTLAAGWRDVWNTRDFRDVRRPAPPAPDLHKTILVVSDGLSTSGYVMQGQLVRRVVGEDTVSTHNSLACPASSRRDPPGSGYENATGNDDAAFNALFDPSWRGGLVDSLGVSELASRLDAFEPADAFRGVSAAFADVLEDVGLPRPTQVGRHLCDYTTVFGPYGRVGDPLYVGGAPVFGASPWPALETLPSPYPARSAVPQQRTRERLYEWWDAACAIAASRGVTVHNVFIGDDSDRDAFHVGALRRCSASTGGETLVTPDAQTLNDALGRLIRLRRTLRFVD